MCLLSTIFRLHSSTWRIDSLCMCKYICMYSVHLLCVMTSTYPTSPPQTQSIDSAWRLAAAAVVAPVPFSTKTDPFASLTLADSTELIIHK